MSTVSISKKSTTRAAKVESKKACRNPDEVVRTISGFRLGAKWLGTLRYARKKQADRPTIGSRWRTRSRALGAIRRPVFILGCPRSGTTFLGSLLGTLPAVSYYFEPPLLKYYTRLIYEGKVGLDDVRRVYSLVFRSLRFAVPGNGPRIVEKNPNHTWVAETLLKVFPDARFVLIERDGRDTALSLMKKPWHLRESAGCMQREPGGYLYGPHPHFYIEQERRQEYESASDLHRCIWIWRRHSEELMRLGSALPEESRFELRYEALVQDTQSSLGQLLAFLKEDDPISLGRATEAGKAASSASIGRWKNRLDAGDLDLIEREAGECLRALGYV